MVRKIVKLCRRIFCRMGFFYLLLVIFLVYVVDRNAVDIKTMNYYRNSVVFLKNSGRNKKAVNDGRLREALIYFQVLERNTDRKILVHSAIGFCHYYLGHYDRSIRGYQKAAALDDGFFGFYYNLGINYFRKKQWSEAVDMFIKSSKISPLKTMLYYQVIARKTLKDQIKRNEFLQKKSVYINRVRENNLKFILVSYERTRSYREMYYMSQAIIADMLGVIEDRRAFYYYAAKASFYVDEYERALMYLLELIKRSPQKIKYKNLYEMIRNDFAIKSVGHGRATWIMKKMDHQKKQEMLGYFSQVGSVFEELDMDLIYYAPYFER